MGAEGYFLSHEGKGLATSAIFLKYLNAIFSFRGGGWLNLSVPSIRVWHIHKNGRYLLPFGLAPWSILETKGPYNEDEIRGFDYFYRY